MNSPRARAAAAWLPPLVWCALIYAASSVPSSTGRRFFPGADRVVHFAVYAALGFLVARALARTGVASSPGRVVLLGALIGAAYGATDEFHQSFVPRREPEWGDFAADAVGAFAGAALYVRLRRPRVTARASIEPVPDPRP